MAQYMFINISRPFDAKNGEKWPPSNTDGKEDGSYYVDYSSSHADLYGPKKDGMWPEESTDLLRPGKQRAHGDNNS